MMDEMVNFRGFSENDRVRTTVRDKLDRINDAVVKLGGERIRTRNLSAGSATSSSSGSSRRPPNRFLKRSESSPSPMKLLAKQDMPALQIPTVSGKQNASGKTDVGVRQMPLLRFLPTPPKDNCSAASSSRPTTFNGITRPSTTQLDVSTTGIVPPPPVLQASGLKPTDPPKRVNKFLNSSTLTRSSGRSAQFGQNIAATPSEIATPNVVNGSSNSDDVIGNSLRVDFSLDAGKVLNAPNAQEDAKTKPTHPKKIPLVDASATATDSNNKISRTEPKSSGAKAEKSQNTPSPQIKEEAEKLNKSSQNGNKPPKPSPAKRTTTTSKLSFLSTQTTRSKRTIVPNKRFFSDDSEQPVKTVVSPPQKSPGKVVGRNSVPTLSTSAAEKIKSPAKKRSLSGDSVRKRKLSTEAPLFGNNLSSSKSALTVSGQSETASPPLEAGGRPRRIIIPNRKFLSENETKEVPVVKKVVETSEPPTKRRKSGKEKPAQSVQVTDELDEKTHTNPNPACDEPRLQNHVSEDKEKMQAAGANNVVFATKTEAAKPTKPAKPEPPVEALPPNLDAVNGDCGANEKKPEENTRLDELPLDADELARFEGKKFVGACILKMTDLGSHVANTGIICCGVCSRLKKYRSLHEKRKQGSYLCVDCGDIVGTIFQSAEKSKPFSSIVGPPVCEGSCPLTFSPPNQFCQACFAKTCLKNLPMNESIYFKIWKCIPPMSRGCLPYSPTPNQASPNVGEVVVINEQGDITVANVGKSETSGPPTGTDKKSLLSSCAPEQKTNGTDDLLSARIATFNHHRSEPATSNCENTIPAKGASDESLTSTDIISNSDRDNVLKTNGVAHEEILLGRQIGQEGVKALVDPILRPDAEDIQTYGFPVIVSGSAYPRKPLCFLCGSAGIEQLIFCSMCCEPYHPYCAGDDLLLDTYISHYDTKARSRHEPKTSIADLSPQPPSGPAVLQFVLKWDCRRCISCKACGESVGLREFLRCNRCHNPFHLQTCIDKPILAKFKDISKLTRVWRCETCLSCKSCGKKIESNQRLKAIEQIAVDVDKSEKELKEEDDDDTGEENVANVNSSLMLCLDCFKQRKKGSYCPLCDKCYDDNDWDSKMMECVKCKRWIHAACEELTDAQYNIIGRLPEYIDYICKLCHSTIPGTPLWYDAIQSMLLKECNSALRLFEQKAIGVQMRKRTSLNKKPSFVCNLFGETNLEVLDDVDESSKVSMEEASPDEIESGKLVEDTKLVEVDPCEKPKLRQSVRRNRTVSGREILKCEVQLRDFVRYPRTLEENFYALKYLNVEVLNENYSVYNVTEVDEGNVPATPIFSTPKRIMFTPKRHLTSVINNLRELVGSIKSVQVFQNLIVREIYRVCETEDEVNALLSQAKAAIKETFNWFDDSSTLEENADFDCNTSSAVTECGESEFCDIEGDRSDPFQEVYWDSTDFFDDRCCALCGQLGDFPPEKCGRLLWCGINEWIHCNCAIWSSEVYELETGALRQVGGALNRGKITRCKVCNEKGATVSCCLTSCKNSYHFLCAMEAKCFLFEDKTMYCSHHNHPEKNRRNIQDDMKVGRKVFVELEWLHKRGIRAFSDEVKVFVGSLKVDMLGSIVPISVVKTTALEDDSSTLLVPKKFKSQRLFWSYDNPWRKESYVFETGILWDGFHSMTTHDVGVNLVVNHSKSYVHVQNGLDNIQKFNEWLRATPKFVDEEFIDWLSPCREEFQEEPNDCQPDHHNLFATIQSNFASGRSSPSSTSSTESSKVVVMTGASAAQKYHLRRLPGRTGLASLGNTTSSDDCASSVESVSNFETQPEIWTHKRRRSLCQITRSMRNNRSRLTPLKKIDSPRRKSMRNLRVRELKEVVPGGRVELPKEEESDDSGVLDTASSTAGSHDEKSRCKINLLAQFEETLDSDLGQECQSDEAFGSDTASLTSSSFSPDLVSPVELVTPTETYMQFAADCKQASDGKMNNAAISIVVKRRSGEVCYESCDIGSAWTFLFDEVTRKRTENTLMPLVHPILKETQFALPKEGAMSENCFRMLGLSHRSVQYLLEQLPGVTKVADRHTFRYSHRPYQDPENSDFPLPKNSSGSARAEGFTRRKPYDMFGWLASRHRKVPVSNCSDRVEEPSRCQGLPLAMRFRDLGERAKRRFAVLRSEIHGRGLFTHCDVDKGDMLIEYAGEMIRHSLSDPREKYYESRGIGCYMFRIKTQVIDATLKGNAARFINHSCEPNCEAKTVKILGKDRIIIFALRKIFKGEELTYDYKFEREENKIPCSCGAARCRRYMN